MKNDGTTRAVPALHDAMTAACAKRVIDTQRGHSVIPA
jgi:hypothetical protein